jgi:hypothetical protein
LDQTYSAEYVDVESFAPFFGRGLGNLLHWIQAAVVDDQTIYPGEFLQSEVHGLSRERRVRHVSSEDLDAVGAILGFQLVEG